MFLSERMSHTFATFAWKSSHFFGSYLTNMFFPASCVMMRKVRMSVYSLPSK